LDCHCELFYWAVDGVCRAPAGCNWRFADQLHRTRIGPKPDLGLDIPRELGQLEWQQLDTVEAFEEHKKANPQFLRH